jgi:uncharacterized protein YdhG (YjbR/CyaY superfamily)
VQSKAKTVDGYIAELPGERQTAMRQLRGIIRKSAPDATEGMQYGMPSYALGELLCSVAAQKGHYSLYVMDTKLVERFRPLLGKLSVGKGCIRFRKLEDAPLDVFGRIIAEAASRRTKGVTTAPCDEGDTPDS